MGELLLRKQKQKDLANFSSNLAAMSITHACMNVHAFILGYKRINLAGWCQ